MIDQALTGVGAQLREAREAAGLAIDDVARSLKLLPRQIESLEHERLERLPGPAITRGMVRNYARLLELDPEPLVERMRPRAPRPPESPPASGRSTLLYVGLAVVLLGAVAVSSYEWQREKARAELTAPVESAPAQAAPAAAPVEKPLENPVEKPVEPQAQAQPIVVASTHRLVLRMEEAAWLELRDGAGRSLLSSLNAAGTERAVSGRPPFELVVGNAAHVSLTYDGRPVDLTPYIKGDVARITLP